MCCWWCRCWWTGSSIREGLGWGSDWWWWVTMRFLCSWWLAFCTASGFVFWEGRHTCPLLQMQLGGSSEHQCTSCSSAGYKWVICGKRNWVAAKVYNSIQLNWQMMGLVLLIWLFWFVVFYIYIYIYIYI